MSYSYDNASELTGISYTNGSTNLGSLIYGYDLAGRRTSTANFLTDALGSTLAGLGVFSAR